MSDDVILEQELGNVIKKHWLKSNPRQHALPASQSRERVKMGKGLGRKTRESSSSFKKIIYYRNKKIRKKLLTHIIK